MTDLAANEAARAWLEAWRLNLLDHGVPMVRTNQLVTEAARRVSEATAVGSELSTEDALEQVAEEEFALLEALPVLGELDEMRRAFVAFGQALRIGLDELLAHYGRLVEAMRPIAELYDQMQARERRSVAARKGWQTRRGKGA